ncbi:MAG: EF-hand domain-containing protein [Ignavibacteriae bacterium]|nr:EF-hand domain-containing protein [Ignavibacteriota bacterium]
MSTISGISNAMSGSSMLDRAAEMFKKFDTSGDGGIDLEEFKAAAPKDGKGGPGGLNPAEMFGKIDTNGDGTIDETEHTTFLKEMESHRPSEPPVSTGEASGVTDLAELLKQIDANGDNTIDQDEQESFLKLMEERRSEQSSSFETYTGNAQGKTQTSSLFSVLM